jgi:hypothetical protein
MQRFFSDAETFDFFQRKSSFSNELSRIPSTKQGRPIGRAFGFDHLFSRRAIKANCHSKNCREIPGGGVGDDSFL